VKFILVSVDDDPKRLDRYVAERKFAFPVLRGTREIAAQKFAVDDTPITYYLDPQGTIRYQVRGGSVFGESVDRVIWYIEELKKNPTSQ
jgi:hypothetical protein